MNEQHNINADMPCWASDREKIYLGYCGNLGEAHSLEFLYAVADNLDVDRFKLILAPYGSKSALLKKYVQGKSGVEVVPSVKRSHFWLIDIHLASLSKGWTSVCVPSKTVSSVCAGSAFLYFGDERSDNWVLLREAGWLLSWDEDIEAGVRKFFSDFRREELARKKDAAQRIAKKLNAEKNETFREIADKIRELSEGKV
jgi:hypothetical protein